MKDLYSVREEDVKKLKNLGLIPEGVLISPDTDETYTIFYDTSEDRDKAFEALYNDRMKEELDMER